jgi:16S rRNA (guanine527-N7)-methyltransferase
MKIGSDAWIDLLISGARQLRIAMDCRQASQLSRFAEILLEWNRTINLTSITDPLEIAVKHLLDSVAPSTWIPENGNLLDIGTGGGFPGVPLKIFRPHQPMLLIDGVRKKVNFVKHVVRELQLERIEVEQIRAEDLIRHPAHPHRFDVIVGRALADADAMLQLAAPLLGPQGQLIVYQGLQKTVSESATDIVYSNGMPFHRACSTYRLPVTGHRRAVIRYTYLG